MHLPRPRGPLSRAVLDRLAGAVEEVDAAAAYDLPAEPLRDDDLQLALWVLYELHYRGFDGVPDRLEWAPDLIAFRGRLEEVFEAALRALAGGAPDGDDRSFVDRLLAVVDDVDGPSVAAYVQRRATTEQVHELLVQRSIYHLKESDPHSWAIPRLGGAAKAALVELQYDEYGAGRPERVHATLFAEGLEAAGLDRRCGAYLDRVPGHTLAETNAMSLFGLHRRLRGASMGHLAAFETTSSLPCRRYAQGLRRLELPEELAAYFDEHVEADAVHEQVALRDICGRMVAEEPELAEDVLLGAAVCVRLEALSAAALVDAWERGATTLLPEPVEAVA